uniref:Uncharacterized protein n=1 Tax=Timema cristinae TaxID=61476 RepID=A0A7R9DKZ7_TIMCR|nr:unnamed protein product [Timema cristinae]
MSGKGQLDYHKTSVYVKLSYGQAMYELITTRLAALTPREQLASSEPRVKPRPLETTAILKANPTTMRREEMPVKKGPVLPTRFKNKIDLLVVMHVPPPSPL